MGMHCLMPCTVMPCIILHFTATCHTLPRALETLPCPVTLPRPMSAEANAHDQVDFASCELDNGAYRWLDMCARDGVA